MRKIEGVRSVDVWRSNGRVRLVYNAQTTSLQEIGGAFNDYWQGRYRAFYAGPKTQRR